MKPSIWSTKRNINLEEGEGGWDQECCDNVEYIQSPYQDEINKLNPSKCCAYYQLSFEYKFTFPCDEVYVAYTVPYTYTQMQSHQKYIRGLVDTSISMEYKFIRFESIGTSNGGMDIPNMRITNRTKEGEWDDKKPIICIIGRQHSGETHSSFIIHGFVNFLVSKDYLAFKLREKFEFWIMPIVNPDGVISGNYRCNTQGRDMN